ncbi:MAG TPA: site-2 protease family protein, partial [Nitrososphaerales archaeon]|nr:site-2 protease family protein [Nitrososphaerales archaeon]
AGPIFDLLYFAYSLGFFVTFINLLPAWQLDGGHIANSAVSPKVHRILTFASVILMFAAGLFLMALLILFMSGRTPSLRPLDDVSPLSRNRKVLFILTWVLAASIGAFVIYNNPIFSPFLFKL